MIYGNNILPTTPSAYQLTGASIEGGILDIDAGGTVSCTIRKEQLVSLTESFQINLVPENFTDNYEPQVIIRILVQTRNKFYNYELFPVNSPNGIYSTEIQFTEIEYETFTFEITAKHAIRFILWELCPQAAGDVEVIIEGVKQSLPRLLYDYNTTPIRVEQSEQIVGMINCYLLNNTDLQGHFLMNFTASDRCTVHIRFFDTSLCELFSPVVHTVNPGHNTIEVPHAYLQKIVGAHNFYVTAQVTNGYLSVPIRGILYTIDGGYLAERLMNPGMDLSDITIKQLASENGPSEIWGIGIDNNQVIVKKRTYSPQQANIAWEAVYVLGEGLAGAIEFDGDWVRRAGSKKHTIHTKELPMIAYVDMNNVLWVYQHGMDSEPLKIAENVSCISMVRGYKSQIYPDQDQGMILAWVQHGNAYYKQFAYFDGAYQWYPTEKLTETGKVTFVQVHRLNDFRVGIMIQSDTENIWHITDRTYVGQSVDTEMVRGSLTGLYTFIHMSTAEADSLNFNATHNAFDSVEEPQQDFIITFTAPIYLSFIDDTIDSWKKHVTVKVNNTVWPAESYQLIMSDNILIFRLNAPVWGNVQISWNKISFWYNLDEKRKILNTQASYSFAWTVVHKMSFTQKADAAYGTLQGSFKFDIIPVQKLYNNYVDPVVGDIAGTAKFDVLPITPLFNEVKESITGAIEGEATFTCELVGAQPI